MKKEYEKIRTMCKNINIPEGKTSDEYLFTLDSTDFFFIKEI